ncbi:tyrosine-type recombinase/integrase [Hyalangium sp.]|uniref:tyrosine-type recombinase/integrase n=1 Tax=Hyalangium sp. TaxID=2028555 RepID=UPI002D68E877|nr:tyrosine-type recombinase/integrase [Hyalangium sp.]HYH95568.1 tyrosine-type recombinase/integrase [Hyalangium sp.]
MTKRLAANRHLKGTRVLYRNNGQRATRTVVSRRMEKAQKRAGLPVTRALHILRHTFCSRLAMRGAPAKALQGWPGTRTSPPLSGTCTCLRRPRAQRLAC